MPCPCANACANDPCANACANVCANACASEICALSQTLRKWFLWRLGNKMKNFHLRKHLRSAGASICAGPPIFLAELKYPPTPRRTPIFSELTLCDLRLSAAGPNPFSVVFSLVFPCLVFLGCLSLFILPRSPRPEKQKRPICEVRLRKLLLKGRVQF